MPDLVIHKRGKERDREVTFEYADIDFRNFQGREGKFNKLGDRNFALYLPEDFVDEAIRDGWNVKRRKAQDERGNLGPFGRPYVAVHVGFKIRPPRMVMISPIAKKRTVLDEDICEMIDFADIEYADVTFRPRPYDINGRQGIKIWLDTIYVVIRENYLDLKYADWDSPQEITKGPGTPTYDWDAEVIAEEIDDEPRALEGRR